MRFMLASLIAACSLALAASAAAQTTPPCVVFDRAGNPIACTPTMSVDASGVYVASGGTYTGPLAAQLPASLGAKTGAASLSVVPNTDTAFPVTGTFWQATQPVSAASLPLPSGAATEATLAAQSAKLPATLGAKVGSASISVVRASDDTLPAGTNTIGKVGVVSAAGIASGSPTFVAISTGYAGYATPTDILAITGSATKTVIVTNVLLLANATSATPISVYFTKRSTANTGGTPTALTATALDSSNAAATAVVNQYGAAPTTGTAVGDVHLATGTVQATTASPNPIGLFIGNGRDAARQVVDVRQPIILRGVAESLTVNLKGVTLPIGLSVSFIVEWVEI